PSLAIRVRVVVDVHVELRERSVDRHRRLAPALLARVTDLGGKHREELVVVDDPAAAAAEDPEDGTGGTLRTRVTLRTLRTDVALRALRTLRTRVALRTL